MFANLRLRLTNLRKKTTDIDWTTRKYFAVFLVIIYIIIFSLVLPYSTTTALEIISSQEQHDFIIPINITLNGTTGFGDPDVVVSLNFKYSKEILVVNDPVNIIGLVVLKSDLADNLTRIVITIENCMEYEKFDQWGIPEQAFLVFDNAPMYRSFRFDEDAKRIVYFINADVKANWHVDGNHKPIIGFYYEDGTNTTRIMDDFSVPVYPKEQLTQIQTNKVTAILSVAVFILSFVGVWELFFHLWDYGSEKRNYPQNNPHNTENDTQIEQEKPKTQINKDSECITENHQAHTNKEKPIMVSESINFLAIF